MAFCKAHAKKPTVPQAVAPPLTAQPPLNRPFQSPGLPAISPSEHIYDTFKPKAATNPESEHIYCSFDEHSRAGKGEAEGIYDPVDGFDSLEDDAMSLYSQIKHL